jgi:hypothetical protein
MKYKFTITDEAGNWLVVGTFDGNEFTYQGPREVIYKFINSWVANLWKAEADQPISSAKQ